MGREEELRSAPPLPNAPFLAGLFKLVLHLGGWERSEASSLPSHQDEVLVSILQDMIPGESVGRGERSSAPRPTLPRPVLHVLENIFLVGEAKRGEAASLHQPKGCFLCGEVSLVGARAPPTNTQPRDLEFLLF